MTFEFVWEAAKLFIPFLLSAAAIALLFAITMRAAFRKAAEEGWFFSVPRALTYFFLFAAFGVVIAYFLSLGLKQDGDNWVNPLVSQFATPLIALLTAAVGYFAKQTAPAHAEPAPANAMPIVAAGVTCFMIECVVSYQGFFLALRDAPP